ncbi:helix-turn-helix domain-containing protein [Halalkalibacterium halodurans]|uniref:helix-turn-helix transcriptional regulator n=1 Tax=Halalkalibacterium halodurans TaxID=86665 RepID=UPI0010681739|nr:helix-turn-helix transcriptional regulator [Halalkalibacterium halodurans]TES56206.1 helix-turn-helix domain-containing protein [Halalkalibacterium halodurans]
MEVKNKLKSMRHAHEMDQKQFAEKLGLRQEQYNRYERQARQPTLKIALEISAKLNMTVNDLFYLE